jgi:cell wall-associated NlpC family hydrolase
VARHRLGAGPGHEGDGPGGLVAVAVGAVVFLLVVAVGATVAFAGGFGAHPSTQTVVFTVAAPYHPQEGPAPTATTVQRVTADLPPMGNWTAERGRQIAQRALGWLGWPYTWDGGDANGPTYGVAVDASSRNDASILGFDCSGLTIYASAPWQHLDHDAATQYTQSGTFHPALDSLQPGDYVFWSKDGTIRGIGHVAIYIGNGLVVQAPYSGAVIRVSRIDQVEPGRIGVTRPLT